MANRTCEGCGAAFEHLGRGRPRRFCTGCRPPVYVRVESLPPKFACEQCGSAAEGYGKYCSSLCRSRAAYEAKRRVPCAVCGGDTGYTEQNAPAHSAMHRECRTAAGVGKFGSVVRKHGTTRAYRKGCRCDECRAAASKASRRYHDKYRSRNGRSYWVGRPRTAAQKAASLKRDALKRGLFVENVDPEYILNRDRWKCHICGKRIGRRYKWPHPRSATMDHVIPLSRGGEHSRQNVKAAHAECNLRKNAYGGDEQLLLFG